MIILGIDPGFTATGFGILQKNGSKIVLLDCGYLSLSPSKTLAERILIFHDFFIEKIEKYQVQLISLETPFLGKNVQNFLKLGYLRGIIYLLSAKFNIPLLEFAPREVKLTVTGFGGAQKDQVARIILKFFPGLTMPNKFDVTDALAVSLCGAWKSKLTQAQTLLL